MITSSQLHLSDDQVHLIAPGLNEQQVGPEKLQTVLNFMPSSVTTIEEALEYNKQADAYLKHVQQQFKLRSQELKTIQAEQLRIRNELKNQTFEPVTPLKSLTKALGSAFNSFKPKPKPDEDRSQSQVKYLGTLANREARVDAALRGLREPPPYIHRYWYARSAAQKTLLDASLPLDVTLFFKELYAAKVYVPSNKRARTTTWYFGLSTSGLYIAISDWMEFRIYESKYCLGKAVQFWKASKSLTDEELEDLLDRPAPASDSLLLKVLAGESDSELLFTLNETKDNKQRTIKYYGSSLGFIWSERSEGNYDNFNKSRYQICTIPSHFFMSASRYLSSRKGYEFANEFDYRIYSGICKRINLSNIDVE